MEKYRCPVCGYINEGPMPLDFKCPRCNQPASEFIKIEEASTNKNAGTKTEKNRIKRICKALIYTIAIIIGVLGAYVFIVYTINAKLPFRNFGEFTGTVLAVLMGYQLLFLLTMEGMKRKIIPESMKNTTMKFTKFFHEFHMCVGTLIVAVIIQHFAINLDVNNLLNPHNLAGCITVLLALTAVIFGIMRKRNLRVFTKAHYIIGFSTILPFIVHMVIK